MDRAPAREPHSLAQQAGDGDRQQQVECDRTQPQPERAAGAREGNETVHTSEIGAKLPSTDVRIWSTRNTIAKSETLRCSESTTKRGHWGVLQRRTSTTPSAIARVSSTSATGARRASQVPVGAPSGGGQRRAHGANAARAVDRRSPADRLAGQSPTIMRRPSQSTKRAGSPRPASHSWAVSARTTAAVAATFAWTQSAAATLIVRQGVRTGVPEPGSMMWHIVCPSWLQRRTDVLEVASPPERIETVCPGAERSQGWSSVTRIRHPPTGSRAPEAAMSPPRLTSTPPAGRGIGLPPR